MMFQALLNFSMVTSIALLALLASTKDVEAQQPRGLEIIRLYFDERSADERRYIQQTLMRNGLYSGQIDGAFGPNTLSGLLSLCGRAQGHSCSEMDLGHPQVMSSFLERIFSGEY